MKLQPLSLQILWNKEIKKLIKQENYSINGICIGYQYLFYIIKNRPIQVFEKFRRIPIGSVGISSITLAELNYGVSKSKSIEKNQDALMKFITPIEVLDFSFEAAKEYGRIRADLETKGTPIGPLDLLIASHALSLNCILVTNNENEFRRIPRLKLENWTI